MLAETTYYVSDLKIGVTSRASEESFQTGGKGINVTKMLQRLGAASTAICFPGGPFGPMCEDWLKQNRITYQAFTEGCVVRSGSVLRPAKKVETSILGVDSIVSLEAIQSSVAFLDAQEEEFVLAICGVIPNWRESTWRPLRELVERRPENLSLAVDTYGPGLNWLAKQNPDVIKINRQELETLFEADVSSESTEDLMDLAFERHQGDLWIVTNGDGPVWYKHLSNQPASIVPKEVKTISATGCGDVFFATILNCLYNKTGYSIEESVKLAVEYASRNVASPGIADFELQEARS